ncbi:hypothetical protein Glove_355g27 [Diversispora epigaea]|uniref:Uncharacterized protein n=1 Tax=Diversispora epigaea TaxID=1348612 RepID=A0A397HFG6_9GLOM|nr:hypothetical protein Glove_355g27 [Diversispora epigaea]
MSHDPVKVLVIRCHSRVTHGPTFEELEELYKYWEDYNNYLYKGKNKDSEIVIQIKKAEEFSANQESTNTTTTTITPLNCKTHPQAIYISRLLNFSNLPNPRTKKFHLKRINRSFNNNNRTKKRHINNNNRPINIIIIKLFNQFLQQHLRHYLQIFYIPPLNISKSDPKELFAELQEAIKNRENNLNNSNGKDASEGIDPRQIQSSNGSTHGIRVKFLSIGNFERENEEYLEKAFSVVNLFV